MKLRHRFVHYTWLNILTVAWIDEEKVKLGNVVNRLPYLDSWPRDMNIAVYRCTHRTRSTKCWVGTVCAQRRPARVPLWPPRRWILDRRRWSVDQPVRRRPRCPTMTLTCSWSPLIGRSIWPAAPPSLPVSALFLLSQSSVITRTQYLSLSPF